MKKRLLSIMLMIIFVLYGCGTNTESADIETENESAFVADVSESVQLETEATQATEEMIVAEEEIQAEADSEQMAETAPVSEQEAESESIAETEPTSETAPAPEAPTTPEPTPTPHTCTWDGGCVTTKATCTEEGIKTVGCIGCGVTKTESIAKTAHDYETESTPATCTEAEKIKTYCSICGDVESESEGDAATGHTKGEKKYSFTTPNGPTCSNGANYYTNCSICDENLETGTDPALPHTEVSTVLVEPTCKSKGTASIDCSECDTHLRNEEIEATGEHTWVETEFDIFNMDILEWEKVPGSYCSVCNAQEE